MIDIWLKEWGCRSVMLQKVWLHFQACTLPHIRNTPSYVLTVERSQKDKWLSSVSNSLWVTYCQRFKENGLRIYLENWHLLFVVGNERIYFWLIIMSKCWTNLNCKNKKNRKKRLLVKNEFVENRCRSRDLSVCSPAAMPNLNFRYVNARNMISTSVRNFLKVGQKRIMTV